MAEVAYRSYPWKGLGALLIAALLLSFPALAAPPGKEAQAPDMDAIVKKVVRAYGGRKAIEGAKALHAKGRTKAYITRAEGSYELYLKRDKKLKVVTVYPRLSEVRVLNGPIGLRGDKEGELSKVEGARYLSMLFHYKHLDLPYGLMKGLYKLEYHGRENIEGKEADVLVLIDEEGPPMKVYIRAEDGLIVRATGFFEVPGGTTNLSVDLSDFRKTGGTVLPYRLLNSGSGVAIGETLIDEYTVDPAVPDSLFTGAPAE